jgi:Xaa-Pro aminopeptidase
LEAIVPLESPKNLMALIRENEMAQPSILGMELDVVPTNNYLYYRKLFPEIEIKDVSYPIRLVRSVKSAYELELIGQAARFSDQVAQSLPDIVTEGMTEIELAGKMEALARKLGHQGIVRMRLFGSEIFYGHLMSGAEAAVPSYLASPTGGAAVNAAVAQGPSWKRIKRNEPILLDYVFAWKGYISDHTRIFAIGKLPNELVDAHACMLELQERIKEMATPGTVSGDLYQAAVDMAEKQGVARNFMGAGKDRIRFVGHGVGLELDEFPFIAAGQKLKLEKGMVIALEPKLIFPGKGVVGVENTHVVAENGLKQLTRAPQEIVTI